MLEIHEKHGLRVAVVRGDAVGVWSVEDTVAQELFVIQAHEAGLCTIEEAGPALGLAVRTLYRSIARVRVDGANAVLHRPRGGQPGGGVVVARDAVICAMRENEGLSARAIARWISVSLPTVLASFNRQGLRGVPEPQQVSLPCGALGGGVLADPSSASANFEDAPDEVGAVTEPVFMGVEAEAEAEAEAQAAVQAVAQAGTEPQAEPLTRSLDTDPLDRVVDRMLASKGQLLDATPLFANGVGLPFAGVLLAIPGLVASGLLVDARRLYTHIGPAFYGLRTSLVLFVLLALLRVKRPENLKEFAPPDLGRIVGLDRAPEVKTLRRKLHRLAAGPVESLIGTIAERRVNAHPDSLGFVYIDGHVRVYSGKYRLPQAHVTRMRISMPAIQDMWVNDADGRPVFHVTQEAHPSLATALAPVLEDLREVAGKGRFTVVFDRGGWSPALFQKLDATGFDVLTYRKGAVRPVPEELFVAWPAPDGGEPWLLNDAYVRLPIGKQGLWMRQITRRRGDHQTSILTTRKDLAPDTIARRMFARWKQENFFKYMREEFALDALVEHGAEDDDPMRDVPDPAWTRADKALREAKAELGSALAKHHDHARSDVSQLEQRIAALRAAGQGGARGSNDGDIADLPDGQPAGAERPAEEPEADTALRDAEAELGRALAAERALTPSHVAEIEQRISVRRAARDALPRRSMVGDLADPPVRLPALAKRLSDALKTVAWHIESALAHELAPLYRRSEDEGRTFIAAAFQSRGDLEVTATELRVTLAPQSSPHRTRALSALCDTLNRTETHFPGTTLRLRYSVRSG